MPSRDRVSKGVTVGRIGVFAIGAAVIATLGKTVGRKLRGIVRLHETVTKILIGIGMSALGWLPARLHLHVFDWWCRKFGRLERLKRLKRS